MNSSIPASQTNVASRTRTTTSGSTWVLSLTGVCFVFGMLLAMQIRAQQRVLARRDSDKITPMQVQSEMQSLHKRLDRESAGRVAAQAKLTALQKQLASVATGFGTRSTALQKQMQDLQAIAGLTPVKGPGIVITMTDNPQAAAAGGNTAFLPGIVHDFDLLQVVNELRSAKAEAIAVKGADGSPIRITGFTAIRCVGPVININGEVVAPPFRIEAIGAPQTLASALKTPDGIIDKLSQLFPIKVRESDNLQLPASENAPKMRVSKVG